MIKLTHKWSASDDPTWDLVPIVVGARVEEYVAIIAACMPMLKPLVVNTLQILGIDRSQKMNTQQWNYRSTPVTRSDMSTETTKSEPN
jgi:hypothetical protein